MAYINNALYLILYTILVMSINIILHSNEYINMRIITSIIIIIKIFAIFVANRNDK